LATLSLQENNMKIGIVTLQETNNYGAVLQAFALQTALQKLGHAPFFPAIQPSLMHRRGIRKVIGRSIGETCAKCYELAKFAVFERFRKRYLQRGVSPKRMLAPEFLRTPIDAPVYITGSDQVWNPNATLPGSADRALFWLDFLDDRIRRIAYGPSFGTTDIPDAEKPELARYISKFNFVSVREVEALPIVASLGKSATWVCDPTLLLSADDYKCLMPHTGECDHINKYLYEYVLHWGTAVSSRQVREYIARRRNMRVYSPFPKNLKADYHIATFDSPGRWVQRIANAEFVLTNSFHGTAFCILFKRPFITIPLSGDAAKSNGRIVSLLNRLGLSGRILKSGLEANIEHIMKQDIDWTFAHGALNAWRKESQDYLIRALS
jgi:hypothetical protein